MFEQMIFTKYKLLLFVILLGHSCQELKDHEAEKNIADSFIVKKEFQSILDASQLKGVILIYDSQKSTYYSNNFEEAKRATIPASTFKIPNSIIGFETKILGSEKQIFKWDGSQRALSVWEKDLTLEKAFQLSCVPCYQELAQKIGLERMKENLKQLKFGDMEVSKENLTNFWLVGNSKVSPFQQIDFLERFYNAELSISDSTTTMLKKIMKVETTEQYTLSGKTGWGIKGEKNIGWFVGYVETGDNNYFFATRILPTDEFDMSNFAEKRKEVTFQTLEELEVLN